MMDWFDHLISWLQRVFGHDHDTRGLPPVYDSLNLPPVPEPSAWMLMLVGVALVLLVARRRRRRDRALNLFDTQWMRDR